MYLYDTNIVSELSKRQCNQNVLHFVQQVQNSNDKLYLSVITLGEITQGIERLRRKNDSKQADKLQNWLNNELHPMVDVIAPFTEECAKVWGMLMGANPHNPIDKQLVATALVHDLIFVTRNVKDIKETGVRYINPFE